MARLSIIVALILASATAGARDLEKLYKKTQFQAGAQKFTAWVADDETRREQGLMFIEKMADDNGMLFVFEQQQPLGFWMKNTLIPLAIGFFDSDGVLIDVQEMKVAPSLMDVNPPTYQSRGPAVFALEMNEGWFTRHNVKNGAKLKLLGPSPSPLLTKQLHLNKKPRH